MTIPTLLGGGGHGAHNQPYDTGDYFGNVGLGRSPMKLLPFTTESSVSQVFRVPGTISYLSWGLDNTSFTSALTLAVNKGSSASALAISIPASTSGWMTDSTHSVTVSSGDALDFSVHVNANEAAYLGNFYCASARFDAATDSAQLLTAVGASGVFTPTTVLQFFNFLGVLGAPGDEGDKQFKCLANGTWQNMACYLESNTFNRVTVVHNRINGASGSMFLSISASTSGSFEDTSHSDSLNAGDYLAYGINSVLSGSGDLDIDWIGAHFLASTTSNCMIGGSANAPAIIVSGTYYSSLFGAGNLETVDVTRVTGRMPYACAASNYTNYITDGTFGSATFTLLKNGAASSLAVTSDAGMSDYFTATGSSAVVFSANDTCANQASLSSGTRVFWANAGLLLQSSP